MFATECAVRIPWVLHGAPLFTVNVRTNNTPGSFPNSLILVPIFPRYERMVRMIVIQCVFNVTGIIATFSTRVTLLAVAHIHGAVLHAFVPCRE